MKNTAVVTMIFGKERNAFEDTPEETPDDAETSASTEEGLPANLFEDIGI